MFCTFCGNEITGDAKFCPKCGKMLLKPVSGPDPAVKAAPAAGPVSATEPVAAEAAGQMSATGQMNAADQPAKKKVPAWVAVLVIIAGALTALGIGIGVFFLMNHFLPRSVQREERVEVAEEEPDDEEMPEDALTPEVEPEVETVESLPEEDAEKQETSDRHEITDISGKGFPTERDFSKLMDLLIDWSGLQFAYGVHEFSELSVQEALPMTMRYILWSNPYDKYRSKTDYRVRVPLDVVKENMEDLFGRVYDLSEYKYDPSAVGANIEGDIVTLGEGDWGEVTPKYEILDSRYYDDGTFTVTVRYYMYDWTRESETGENYFIVYDCEVAKDKPNGFIIKDMHTDNTIYYAEPAATPDPDYILPESGIRNLTEQDLWGLTDEELRLARNEIYARHGRRFNNKELQDYFDSKPWYNGTIAPGEWSEKFLNKYETYNVDFISRYE